MHRIFVPTSGLLDWKERLVAPDLHWVRGHSAYELAVAWEAAAKTDSGLPPCVESILRSQPDTNGASLILAAPEHKVALKGQGYSSQTDLWALLKSPGGLVSLAVEGKAGEPFDKIVSDWLKGSGDSDPANRQARLQGLGQTLALSDSDMQPIRYQLLHRTASAILEAQRCGAGHAIMLVQSFGTRQATASSGFDDFKGFAMLMGAKHVTPGQLLPVRSVYGLRLSLGWLDCPVAA